MVPFTLPTELKSHAVALGNPTVSPPYTPRARVDQKIQDHGCSTDPGCRASTLFLVDSDSTIYDSGFYVLVTYYLNSVVPDCEENVLINLEEDSPMRVEFFETKILPQLSFDNFITKVVIATQTDGTVAVNPDSSATIDYLGSPFPPGFIHRDVPVPISHLRRLPGMRIWDIVVRQDVSDQLLYVFKKELDISTLTTHVDHQSDLLLQEALFLMRLDSAFILKPSSLVSDSTGRFRGYLLPFQPAGSLANVLSNVRKRDVPVLQPYTSEGAPQNFLHLHAQLDWKIKNAWAVDIASGIDYLHKQNTFWGDVKLDNIVLSPDGRCRLIDCAPIMGMSDPYAAPEIEDLFHNPFGRLTSARDVFALGLVLWALAEETERFTRAVDFVAPRLSWTTGNNFAPMWYQDMVNQCVAAEPSERPAMPQILDVLSRLGSL